MGPAKQALKILERAAAEPGGDRAPLAEVSDNVTGNTPVMYAAMENKISIMTRMLDLGSDIHAKNKVGKEFGGMMGKMWSSSIRIGHNLELG